MATIERLLAILDLFTLERPQWSVEEASLELGMPPSTTYRYFKGLTNGGLLTTVGTARYGLGPAIIRYDWQLRMTDPLLQASRGEMERLAQSVARRAVVFLCRLIGDNVMCVAQTSDGDPPLVRAFERGRPMPLFAGSASRVILAQFPSARIRNLYRANAGAFTKWIAPDERSVRDALRNVRTQGFFTTVGEIDPGMRGISVPVMVLDKVIGSLSFAGPKRGFSRSDVTQCVAELSDAARRIGNALNLETTR